MNKNPWIQTSTARYTVYGALFGFCFPVLATALELIHQNLAFSLNNIILAQTSAAPMSYIIDTAPFFLGLFAFFAGIRQDSLLREIDKRQRAEVSLQKTLDELETRIEERTVELTETNEKLKAEITERKQAEEELRESEKHYRTIIHTALDGFWINDMQGRIIDVNESYCQMIGYSREELLKMSISDVEAVEKYEETAEHIKHTLEHGYDRFETRHRLKDGKIIDIEISTTYSGEAGGQFVVFIRDITERKRSEEALRQSEAQYRSLIEQSNDAIYLLYQDKFVLINKKFTETLGVTPEEAREPNFNFMELVAPQSRALIEERSRMVERGVQPPQRYEFVALTKEGKEIEVEASVTNVSYRGGIAVQGILHDITARRRAEEALKRSEEQYRLLIENLGEGIGLADLEESIVFFNPAGEEIFGIPSGTHKGRNLKDFMSPEVFEKIREETEKRISGEKSTYEIEVTRPDEGKRQVLITANPWRDDEGKVLGTFGIFRDITEQKRLEKALQESEVKHRSIIDTSMDGIVSIDDSGTILLFNQAAEEMFGYEAAEVVGKNVNVLMPSPYKENHNTYISDYLTTGIKKVMGICAEVPGIRKDGTTFPIEISLSEMVLGYRRTITSFLRNITQRKKAEEEREKLIVDLQEALQKIKTLKGLVPICSSCKKIRDDQGYWQQVEVYVRDHSEAEFSHGICPDCMKKLYPEYCEDD